MHSNFKLSLHPDINVCMYVVHQSSAVFHSQYVKSKEMNPHAKEAWKVTKSGVKGTAFYDFLER